MATTSQPQVLHRPRPSIEHFAPAAITRSVNVVLVKLRP